MKTSLQNMTPQKMEKLKVKLNGLGIFAFELDFLTNQITVALPEKRIFHDRKLTNLLTEIGLKTVKKRTEF
jgi:hypothetical protein